jgi:hypothetical protein
MLPPLFQRKQLLGLHCKLLLRAPFLHRVCHLVLWQIAVFCASQDRLRFFRLCHCQRCAIVVFGTAMCIAVLMFPVQQPFGRGCASCTVCFMLLVFPCILKMQAWQYCTNASAL